MLRIDANKIVVVFVRSIGSKVEKAKLQTIAIYAVSEVVEFL
jgi:hypothetical protein